MIQLGPHVHSENPVESLIFLVCTSITPQLRTWTRKQTTH